MAKLATIAMIATVIGLGAQFPTQAMHDTQTEQLQPVPDWVYLWVQRSDQVADIWRGTVADRDWSQVGAIPGNVVDVISTTADPQLALALTDQAVYRSTDAGQTWEAVSGLPDWPTALTLSQQTAGLVYLGTLNSGAFRSADTGTTWAALTPVVNPETNTLPEVTAMTVQPQDDRIIFMATGYWLGTMERQFTPQGIFMSLDGGETWQMIHEAALDEPRVTALIPDLANPRAIQAAGEDGSHWYVFGDPTPADQWLPNDPAQPLVTRA